MRRVLIIVFCILGLIVGVILGSQMASVGGLSWLSLGGQIGFTNPIVLDLNVMQITFGFWCRINVGGLIGLIIFAIISRWLVDWIKI